MICDADADYCGEPQRHREAEGMEERQDAEEHVAAIELHRLRHLLDIRNDIEVREHYAFGLARAAAGENDGREIVELRRAFAAENAFKKTARQRPEKQCNYFFAQSRLRGNFFEQNGSAGRSDRQAIEKEFRG